MENELNPNEIGLVEYSKHLAERRPGICSNCGSFISEEPCCLPPAVEAENKDSRDIRRKREAAKQGVNLVIDLEFRQAKNLRPDYAEFKFGEDSSLLLWRFPRGTKDSLIRDFLNSIGFDPEGSDHGCEGGCCGRGYYRSAWIQQGRSSKRVEILVGRCV